MKSVVPEVKAEISYDHLERVTEEKMYRKVKKIEEIPENNSQGHY